MKKHVGFTLIELIIVIVILGILAAFAIPKYIQLDKQARVAVVDAMGGSVRAGATLVHALALSQGNVTTVTIEGNIPIALTNDWYPVNEDIQKTIADTAGFDTNTAGVFIKNGANDGANCRVTYTATPGAAYNVVTLNTGC